MLTFIRFVRKNLTSKVFKFICIFYKKKYENENSLRSRSNITQI